MKNTTTYSTSESLPLSEPDVETNSLDFGIVLENSLIWMECTPTYKCINFTTSYITQKHNIVIYDVLQIITGK